MEEEARKRSTDCLYFLASPLTCKKGSECDYRHSDSARLNPRDCWYWLNGNCRNTYCAFRHPPLDGLAGGNSDSHHAASFSAAPSTKSNVPCYFYFNTFCAKGEQCPFLHETVLIQKPSSKQPLESASATHPSEAQLSGDTGPASIELPINPPSESLPFLTKTDNLHLQEASRSVSAESTAPEFHEPPADNPLPSIEFLDQSSHLSLYLNSQELAKECVDQDLDERWESSPGFDVLVDGGSEDFAFEQEVEYQHVQNRESESRHNYLLKYEYEGSSGYPDSAYLYDENYEDFHRADDVYTASEYYQLPGWKERIFELERECEVHDMDGIMDLQVHLGKRRTDTRRFPENSRRRRRSNSRSNGQERQPNNGWMHGRLASHVDVESARSYQDRQNWEGRGTRGGHWERERRHQRPRPCISSEVQHRPFRDDEESARITGFLGPKTLAEIKEEKRRANAEDGKKSGAKMGADFEGPKPLEELLKHKRSEKLQEVDGEEEDEDEFRRRLVHMASH